MKKKNTDKKGFLYTFWLRFLSHILFLEKNVKLLDAGCGFGFFARTLASRYFVCAIDISAERVFSIKESLPTNLYPIQADVIKLPFCSKCFSVVIAFDLIEHLFQPEAFFDEASRVLKNGGFLILSTPNPDSFGNRVKSKHSGITWFGWRDKTHINIRSIEVWRSLFQKKDFEINRDGTDWLWDIPYFKFIPQIIQKIFFISLHKILTKYFGFFTWTKGENYWAVLIKSDKAGS